MCPLSKAQQNQMTVPFYNSHDVMIENVMFRRNKVKCLSGKVRDMLNQDELKGFLSGIWKIWPRCFRTFFHSGWMQTVKIVAGVFYL